MICVTMSEDFGITEEDLVIEEAQGYPRAYAKICRDFDVFPYRNGPPFTFMPYILQQNEVIEYIKLGFLELLEARRLKFFSEM